MRPSGVKLRLASGTLRGPDARHPGPSTPLPPHPEPREILPPPFPSRASRYHPCMSQYRDDRDAARLRIEALEDQVKARDAELEAQGMTLAAREAEIARLRRELD